MPHLDRDAWDGWHHDLDEAADKLVHAETLYKTAEALKKRVFAKLFLMYRESGLSQKDAEFKVITDEEYDDIVKQEIEAHTMWKDAKYEYDRAKMWLESQRTIEASRRVEMGLT